MLLPHEDVKGSTRGSPRRRLGREREIETVTEVRVRKGESVDKALRRLKKKLDKEGTMKAVRQHRHYEKPSERRRRKQRSS